MLTLMKEIIQIQAQTTIIIRLFWFIPTLQIGLQR